MSDRKKKLIQGGFTSIPPGATAEELANKATTPQQRVAEIRAKLKDSNLIQESLRTPSPRHEGGNLSVGDDLDGSQMLLPVMEILLYDRNPRKSRNPQFNEIKESIRQKGVQHPPNVTKRPGSGKYMVYGGGNTRLLAMQELWLETRDPKFERMMAFYRPWVNEAAALAAHLVENEQRADMVFYDKVQGYMDLKREYENAFGPLSSRRFEELLKGDGLPASKTILHIYNYAYIRLSPLGLACYGLSKNSVRDVIQPRLNLAMRLAQRFECDEDAYYTLIGNTMREYAAILTAPENLDAAALCQACEQTLAATIGLAPDEIGPALELVQKFPDLSAKEVTDHLRKPTATKLAEPVAAAAETSLPTLPGQQRLEEAIPSDPPTDTALNGEAIDAIEAVGGFSSILEQIDAPSPSTAKDANKSPRSAQQSSEAKSLPSAVSPSIDSQMPTPASVRPVWKDLLQRYATSANIANLLVVDDSLPSGFYINPPSTPLSAHGHLGDPPTNQYVGWWMLAVLSGQLRPDFHLYLPTDSEWRRLQESEDEGEFSATVDTLLGGAPPLSAVGDFMIQPTAESKQLRYLAEALSERPPVQAHARYLPILGQSLLDQVLNLQPVQLPGDAMRGQKEQVLTELGYAFEPDSGAWIYTGVVDED